MIALWLYLGFGAGTFFGVLGYLMHKARTRGEVQEAMRAAWACGLLWPAVLVSLCFNWFDVEQ